MYLRKTTFPGISRVRRKRRDCPFRDPISTNTRISSLWAFQSLTNAVFPKTSCAMSLLVSCCQGYSLHPGTQHLTGEPSSLKGRSKWLMTVKLNYIRLITAYAWHISRDHAMVRNNKGHAWCPVILSGKATALPACFWLKALLLLNCGVALKIEKYHGQSK